ncbi:MAG: hypothetical protein KC448_12130 [Yoonia sp.]|nr:hypothetical protein [Yoonia sp.]
MSKPTSQLNKHIHATLLDMLGSEPTSDQLNQALRLLAKWRARLIENTVIQKSGHTIKHGPFTGMNYGVQASEGGGVPRLLGGYEPSLAPIIDDIVASGPALIIDVGSAEGYYAVGLARRLPNATIWARDADEKAQAKCTKLAALNGVSDRVEIGGIMTHADFDICARHRTVVICDIEGAEADLLNPSKATGLFAADILVECHPAADKSIVSTLQERFAATHQITRLDRDLDTRALPKWMDGSSDLDRLLALWEWRSAPTPWLWMTKRPANQ